jgi:hypothetical protein
MTLNLSQFDESQIDPAYVEYLLDNVADDHASHYGRLWDYFRNPATPASGAAHNALNANSRPYFQAQEYGLPPRITGVDRLHGGSIVDLNRKEVVIENDIAWRVQTMVDYLFGRGVRFRSLAAEPAKAEAIEAAIEAVIDANGGLALLQEMALLGSVYGFADVALRTPAGAEAAPRPLPPTPPAADAPPAAHRSGLSYCDAAANAAAQVALEVIEAPRVLPILADDDYRTTRLWVQRYTQHPARMAEGNRPWHRGLLGPAAAAGPETVEVVEILGARWWQRYHDRVLVAEGPNPLGAVPVVHIQNIAQPGRYEGLGDVEGMVPLQDELNTRLSDRAQRVTFQSFRMYLGKCIDDFIERPVGPGQMWATWNPDASIEEFGSDSGSPSEDAHIAEVRQAMDKVSGVSPLAAGLVRGNVGQLTSATALRVLLSGLLARTARKRLTYGAGLVRLGQLVLGYLHRRGVLATTRAERRLEVIWPDPLPIAEPDRPAGNGQAEHASRLGASDSQG